MLRSDDPSPWPTPERAARLLAVLPGQGEALEWPPGPAPAGARAAAAAAPGLQVVIRDSDAR
eukprot:367758-Hanusia_phi.AAC.6